MKKDNCWNIWLIINETVDTPLKAMTYSKTIIQDNLINYE